jgi:hypothetical protein
MYDIHLCIVFEHFLVCFFHLCVGVAAIECVPKPQWYDGFYPIVYTMVIYVGDYHGRNVKVSRAEIFVLVHQSLVPTHYEYVQMVTGRLLING